jgi:hypothetical protein
MVIVVSGLLTPLALRCQLGKSFNVSGSVARDIDPTICEISPKHFLSPKNSVQLAQVQHPLRKGYYRAVGKRNYLIGGVSGAGKTAVCTELQRRGYQAINGDEELAYQGDPDTGQPTDGLKHEHSATYISEHHIWDVEKVKAFVANQDEAVTFFCGGSKNSSKYIALFDGVFVLEVDLDTSLGRIDERVALDPTDWGGTPAEREITVRMYHSKEGVPKNGIIIDATAPLARVVDEILRLSDGQNTR